ncbi:hypothetical protein BX070DRAFT_224783 [Coemansia spiralis]|nr:hypothetical protein BX070DRAFT_224783 [Coemansia spiralis]
MITMVFLATWFLRASFPLHLISSILQPCLFMSTDDSTFKAFDAYSFDSDSAFQAGLRSIPNSHDPQILQQAKAFYFSKTHAPLNLEEYSKWKAAQQNSAQSADDAGFPNQAEAEQRISEATKPEISIPGAPYSASFAEVVEMITSGKEIPGIRDIPDKLNEQVPSMSTAKPPPKPWERQQETE